ncbi:hypothetical protein K490DRAFT_69021 [Saccharata proteae CBS 121410]|uniref:Rad60/SUMO-like domain-containing protein n=1 Tax=Saccharata proteae CBS 121410 TaxID=1314787 RepID=A0A9P4LUK3_9PEZI|nr:hypothetical protein K490DRAFT_69021 [Saccharata proteae CBS 121410]
MNGDGAPVNGGAAKPKRSIFKKPSWAKKDRNQEDEDGDMFSNRGKIFSDVMAEQERERKAKLAAQKAAKRERTHSREPKRRRVSQDRTDSSDDVTIRVMPDVDTGNGNASPDVPEKDTETSKNELLAASSKSPSVSLPARYNTAAQSPTSSRETPIIIDLGDSDSDDDPAGTTPVQSTPQPRATSPADSLSDHEPDPEMREMIRHARRRRKERELASSRSTQDSAKVETHSSTLAPSGGPPDPVLQLLITSRIPNSKPLMVARKLSQPLKPVRLAWCAKQGFSDEMTDSVFLSFRNTIHLYDFNTCRSLGLEVSDDGKVVSRGSTNAFSDCEGRVELEAVTQEIFEENQAAAKRKFEAEPEPEAVDQARENSKAKQMKLIVKSKEYSDYKLYVNPDTTFARICRAFAKQNDIPPDKRESIYAAFDGDRLDPEAVMQSLEEFESGDAIEIYFE